MLEFIPVRLVNQRRSEGWKFISQKRGDYAAIMEAPEGWQPPLLADRKPFRTCSINGCDGKHLARGFCDMHYKRIERYGNPNDKGRHSWRGCSEADCTNKHRGRGLCEMHLSRVRRAEKRVFECRAAA